MKLGPKELQEIGCGGLAKVAEAPLRAPFFAAEMDGACCCPDGDLTFTVLVPFPEHVQNNFGAIQS